MPTSEIESTPSLGSRAEALMEYFCAQTPGLYRPAQGCLKHPFLVPGGLFHDEMWDWDSFWITVGMAALKEELGAEASRDFLVHARGSLCNFLEHQTPEGTVPIMIKAAEGDFFGCTRPHGSEKNQAKPVLAQFALTLAEFAGDLQWVAPYYEKLALFLHRWRGKYGTACGLLVWGSDAAIGVDNDPTTYGRPAFSSANLLLNCLYHAELRAMAQIADALGRPADATGFEAEFTRLGAAIQSECWDPIDGFFYTVDVQGCDHRLEHFPQLERGMDMSWQTMPLKIKMFTGFLPLYCGLATPEQARVLVERHLRNPLEFNAVQGIRSLAANERMYDPARDSANPSNWLGPIWIVANYLVVEGLRRYGFDADAREFSTKIIHLLAGDLERHGYLHECYHPDSGAPNFNARFLSWNVLAGALIKKDLA